MSADIKVSLEKMQKCITCLAIQLPESVWDDVNKHWQNLKSDITELIPEKIELVDRKIGEPWQVQQITRMQLLMLCVCYRGIDEQTYLLTQKWSSKDALQLTNDLIEKRLLFADMSLKPDYRPYMVTSIGHHWISNFTKHSQLTCNQIITLLDFLLMLRKNNYMGIFHVSSIERDMTQLKNKKLITDDAGFIILTDKALDIVDNMCNFNLEKINAN